MGFLNRRYWEIEKRLWREFWEEETRFFTNLEKRLLGWMIAIKNWITKLMYRQRGRFSQSFINTSMAILAFLAIAFSSRVEEIIRKKDSGEGMGSNYLIMAAEGIGGADTLISDLPKGEIIEYRVEEGDTLSSIAQKFGVSLDTIIWENNLKSVDAIKPRQIIRILPVTGVRYKVSRGETIHSIAKKFQVDPQNIIDYPFNSFANDETFALIAGQELIIPDGIKPKEVVVDTRRYVAQTVAPIPGVVGEGNFIWPTNGRISQRFSWYHPGVDIANSGGPIVNASQRGTVVTVGWDGRGYGNYIIVNHGNGYQTLYGHLASGSIIVSPGTEVGQGQKLGNMGSTGRSTGTHLHFEIIGPKNKLDPLTVLK